MSKKKKKSTNNQDIGYKIKKLKELKESLESELKKEKQVKQKAQTRRNLRIFKSTCKFLMPFVVTSGFTVCATDLLGGGLPFYKDDVTMYKMYFLECEADGDTELGTCYATKKWYDKDSTLDGKFKENSLVIYSPWEKKNNGYERYKREYIINENIDLDLYHTILNSNYEYIESKLPKYKEEIQAINQINEDKPNGFKCQASLRVIDKGDTCTRKENETANIAMGVFEVAIALSLGACNVKKRKFHYTSELVSIKKEYKIEIGPFNKINRNLEKTNNKIKRLEKDGIKR